MYIYMYIHLTQSLDNKSLHTQTHESIVTYTCTRVYTCVYTWTHSASNNPSQRIPGTAIKPVEEVVEAIHSHVVGGAIVEPTCTCIVQCHRQKRNTCTIVQSCTYMKKCTVHVHVHACDLQRYLCLIPINCKYSTCSHTCTCIVYTYMYMKLQKGYMYLHGPIPNLGEAPCLAQVHLDMQKAEPLKCLD